MNSFLFSLGWVEIKSANIIVLLGFLVSLWILTRTVHEKKLSLKFLSDHLFLFSITSLLVGRMGALLMIYPAISEKMLFDETWQEKSFTLLESFFSFWHGGINVFWAIGSFLFIFLLLCSIKNEHPLAWLDAFSLPTVAFLIFFSVASFFGGWNYGKPVSENFPFGIRYENNNHVIYSGEIHPVQLYAALLFFFLFIISFKIWGKKVRESWPNGIFGGILLSSLFFLLSFLEFFRGHTPHLIFEVFPISSLIFFGFGFIILIFMIARGHFHVFSQFKKIISQ